MSRHVNRVADVKEDALESLYEKRLRKKSLLKEKDENLLQVDRSCRDAILTRAEELP